MIFKKEKDILSIAVTDQSLRLVWQKTQGDQTRLVSVSRRDLREVQEDDVPRVMADCVKELNVKKPQVMCILPTDQVTTKNIEIPSLDPDEIQSIIELQAGRHTPYSREEILLGYITVGIFQRNYTKVLLVIVNRDVVMKQIGLISSCGLMIDKVLFAPEAVARFYGDIMDVQIDEAPVGIIDLGHHATTFVIEFNRTVATSRSIPLGLTEIIKDGQPAVDRLIAELLQSIEAYQNEDITRLPETYLLTSDDAKVKELQPQFQDKLKANVTVRPYLDHIQGPQEVLLKLVSEYNDDSFLGPMSAGSVTKDLEVDLLPSEIKVQRQIQEKGREVVKLGVLSIFALLLVCAIFFSKLYFRGVYVDKLTEVYNEKHKKVQVLDRVAQKTQIIKNYVNSRMVALDTIEELYRLIPDEMYLQFILLDEDGKIQISGISDSMSMVFNFVTALEDSEMFKNVKPKSTTAKKDRGKDVAAFEIDFFLESAKEPAEEEPEAPQGEEEPQEES